MANWKFTEKSIKDQIKAAKEKYKEQRIKLERVYYEDECLHFVISGTKGAKLLWFNKRDFKCLRCVSDEKIARVSLLGGRAIQWEELDIQIGLDKLFDGIQLKEDWYESISK